MCRNIRPLFNFDPPATDEEIFKASEQFVRKVSGFTKPSKINELVFNQAVREIANTVNGLLKGLETKSRPKKREEEAEKARKRYEKKVSK